MDRFPPFNTFPLKKIDQDHLRFSSPQKAEQQPSAPDHLTGLCPVMGEEAPAPGALSPVDKVSPLRPPTS